MDRKTYIEEVLASLRRLTITERDAVRMELNAHMEDRMADLMDMGYDEELAEARTMACMGDPVEVGRELNKQYPLGWLLLKWAAAALALAMTLTLLTLVEWGYVKTNLAYRFCPALVRDYGEVYGFLEDCRTSIRVPVGDTVMHVSAVGIYQLDPEKPGFELAEELRVPEDQLVAAVEICGYPTSLLDIAREPYCPFPDIRGRSEGWYATGGGSAWIYLIPVERGETELTGTYTSYGHDVSFTIPLDWEVVL